MFVYFYNVDFLFLSLISGLGLITYLFKNGLGSQVFSLPRTSKIKSNQLAEVVTSFIYSECYSPWGTSPKGSLGDLVSHNKDCLFMGP